MSDKYAHLTDDEKRETIRVLRSKIQDDLERQLYDYREQIKHRTDTDSEDYRGMQKYIDSAEHALRRDGIDILPDEPL